MHIKLLSKNKQIENLLVLRAVIEQLPDSSIAPSLQAWAVPGPRWRRLLPLTKSSTPVYAPATPEELMANGHCGAAACVGGWVAIMPHFHKLGVWRDPENGAPMMGMGAANRSGPWSTASHLFGYRDMFAEAGMALCDPDMRPDEDERAWGKRCALARIDHALEELLS